MGTVDFQVTPLTDSGGGTSAIDVYTMQALQNGGPAYVYWENSLAPDFAGTGPTVPPGVLTQIKWVYKQVVVTS